MYRILIFGVGACYDQYLNCVRLQEAQEKVKVVGVTRNGYEYSYVDGYPFVQVKDIEVKNYDICVIAAEQGTDNYREIRKTCETIGFNKNNIVPIRAFSIPNFDMEKYLKIQNISIMALNCWGGAYLSCVVSAIFEPVHQYVRK